MKLTPKVLDDIYERFEDMYLNGSVDYESLSDWVSDHFGEIILPKRLERIVRDNGWKRRAERTKRLVEEASKKRSKGRTNVEAKQAHVTSARTMQEASDALIAYASVGIKQQMREIMEGLSSNDPEKIALAQAKLPKDPSECVRLLRLASLVMYKAFDLEMNASKMDESSDEERIAEALKIQKQLEQLPRSTLSDLLAAMGVEDEFSFSDQDEITDPYEPDSGVISIEEEEEDERSRSA